MKRSLEVLGTRVVVDFDEPELVDAFFQVFSGFAGSAKPRFSRGEVRVTISHARSEYVTADGRVPLSRGALRSIQVFNLLYSTVLMSVNGFFLLHAAAVERDGEALLIGGPGGSGKTSLARALVERGFRLLSDDIAPLSVADGRVHPFPRRIGLVPDDLGEAPEPANTIRLGDKVFATAESLGLPTPPGPARPAIIALVNPYPARGGVVRLRVGLIADARVFIEGMHAVPGARIVSSERSADLTVLRIELAGDDAVVAVTRALRTVRSATLFLLREHGPEKAYVAHASIEPVTPRAAAVEVLAEMLNRDPDSALIRGLHGNLTGGLFELSGLLKDADCLRLVQSDVDRTADLLVEVFTERRVPTGPP